MEFDSLYIEKKLGYTFSDKSLLKNAFTHSSYANEHRVQSNERLEFLGDSVLSVVITDELYHSYKKSEGDLSKIRASLVSEKSLAFIFSGLSLDKYIICGEAFKTAKVSQAMIADAFEATLAAIYLDGGITSARKVILSLFEMPLKAIRSSGVPESHKSKLQEKFKTSKIYYQTVSSGEGENKVYKSRVFINGVMSGIGIATKKREAEELSALEALKSVEKV